MTALPSESLNRDGRSAATEPTPNEATERDSSCGSGCLSRLWNVARTIVEDFGRYGTNGDYYLLEDSEEESASKDERAWPRTDAGTASIFTDSYGLIYR